MALLNANDFFTLTSLIHSTNTRRHTYKLFPHCNRVDLYKYFVWQRIGLDTWNSLPAKPNDFSSLARFTRLVVFSERQLRYVRYMPSPVRLSFVCLWRWCTLLSRLKFSAIFIHHTIAQGL